MKKIAFTLASAAAGFSFASPASAADLIGQEVTYCTNSVYSGVVTIDPGQCSESNVFTSGIATIVDPGVEINLANNRFIDLSSGLLTITYNFTGSPSPDLFVLTGLSGIGGLSLISDNLGVETLFSNNAIGLLVSGNPNGPGFAQFAVANANAVPEPSTWIMMLLGFGLVGGAMRSAKRRQKSAVAYA